jgi:hypothetical protein
MPKDNACAILPPAQQFATMILRSVPRPADASKAASAGALRPAVATTNPLLESKDPYDAIARSTSSLQSASAVLSLDMRIFSGRRLQGVAQRSRRPGAQAQEQLVETQVAHARLSEFPRLCSDDM